MKEAQECRPGQIVKKDGALWVITEWEQYKKGDRGGIIIDMKLRNIDTGSVLIIAPRAQDKFEDVSLERKKCQYSYHDGNLYIFMDTETFEQVEISKDVMGDNIVFLKENMEVDIFFHEGRAVKTDFPLFVIHEIAYTENAVRADTSGRVMKKAKLDTGYEIDVPSFVNIGDKVKIDTRTHEYIERANK